MNQSSSHSKIDFSERASGRGANDLFVQRWSPRAFRKTAIESSVLTRIMEAARWSPSCFNEQPWRFYTSTPDTFDDFLGLLVEGNQDWAREASVIGVLVAEKNFARNGKTNDWAGFDCGSAWMAMSLQARMEGLYTHGMAGVHFDRAADYLKLDASNQKVLMAFVIGELSEPDHWDDETRQREKPTARKPLNEIWMP